jgi:hypothetical protein
VLEVDMPEHPYTKLLEELDSAHFVRYDKASGLIYAWHGETRVQVYNKEGACVDFFSLPPDVSVADVAQRIDSYIAEESA